MDSVLGKCEGSDFMYDRGNLTVCKDAVFHESAGDNDLIAFLTEIGRTPIAQTAGSSAGSPWSYTSPPGDTLTRPLMSDERLLNLQDVGLRSSPASTSKRKRKYSSTGDLDQLNNNPRLPARVSWDTDSGDELDARKASAVIPLTPALQVQTTPMKRSASTGLAALMPFALVKEYPSQESMSLADANRRIQAFAEADSAACTPQSSNSSSGLLAPAASRPDARPRIHVDRIFASGDDLPFGSQGSVSQGSFF